MEILNPEATDERIKKLVQNRKSKWISLRHWYYHQRVNKSVSLNPYDDNGKLRVKDPRLQLVNDIYPNTDKPYRYDPQTKWAQEQTKFESEWNKENEVYNDKGEAECVKLVVVRRKRTRSGNKM